MLVDSLVIGDTPFAVSVQDTLRDVGYSSFLVYTGDVNIRYMYSEEVDIPHTACKYELNFRGDPSFLTAGRYIDWYRSVLGGDYRFFYDLSARSRDSKDVVIRISYARADKIEERGGLVGDISSLSMKNRKAALSNGQVIHFGTLVVAESLKTFLERISIPDPGLKSTSLGVILEEFVDILPPTIELGDRSLPTTKPLLSMSRGYLKTHFVIPEGDRKVNALLQDYVKIPTYTSMEITRDLETPGYVFFYGPRAVWNSGLTHGSEILRMLADLSEGAV